MVKWLLFLNPAIFLIANISGHGETIVEFLSYKLPKAIEVWRWLTFQFMHDSFGHLIFNMIALYCFGGMVENHLKGRAFLVFYLLCGVVGAAAYSVYAAMFPSLGAVGASAGIFGILMAVVMINPPMQVSPLFLPITVTPRQLAMFFLIFGAVIAVIGIVGGLALTGKGKNTGGEVAHLGGALAGFLFFKVAPLRKLLTNLGASRAAGGRPGPRKKKKRYEKKLKPKSNVTKAEEGEIDRILDKINENGLQSLTESERELLTRAGKKK